MVAVEVPKPKIQHPPLPASLNLPPSPHLVLFNPGDKMKTPMLCMVVEGQEMLSNQRGEWRRFVDDLLDVVAYYRTLE